MLVRDIGIDEIPRLRGRMVGACEADVYFDGSLSYTTRYARRCI